MKAKGHFVVRVVCSLLEGACYCTQMGDVCTVYLRARSIRGRVLNEGAY